MSDSFVSELEEMVSDQWAKISQGRFWSRVMSEPVSLDLYQGMMEQLYHYTRHNSINQAAAAYSTNPVNRRLLKFMYKHASEELGHEYMVIHDLKVVGRFDESLPMKSPLPATQALIGYLYHVAMKHGGIARLGYSFWAENCYGFINPILEKIAADLKLLPRDMTFFVAHSEIDTKHAVEVADAIVENALSEEEKQAVRDVAQTTLYLTGQLLEQVEEAVFAERDADLAIAA